MIVDHCSDQNKTESIKISISLVLQFEEHFPSFDILLDNTILQSSLTINNLSKNQNFNFQQTLAPGTHCISVRYREIPDAMTNVEISNISFDDIPVRLDYINTHSTFYTDSPTLFDGSTVNSIELYRHLGISGIWKFSFMTPLLLWRMAEDPHPPLPLPPVESFKFAKFDSKGIEFVDSPETDPDWVRAPEVLLPFLDKIISRHKNN
jgi:hypothetical protein